MQKFDYEYFLSRHNVLILDGKDASLIYSRAHNIIEGIKNQHQDAIHKNYVIDKNFSLANLKNTTLNLHLFSQLQIIELHIFNHLNYNIAEFLRTQKKKDIFWIILNLNKKNSPTLTKLFSPEQVLKIYVPNFYDLPQWIQKYFKMHDFNIDLKISNLLAQNYHANFNALDNLLNQLKGIYLNGTLSLQQISPLLEHCSIYTVFDLLNAIEDNNISLVIKIFRCLKEQRLETAIIFWGLSNELKMLLTLKSDPSVLNFKKYKLNKTRELKISRLLHNVPLTHYLKLAKQLQTLEIKLKSTTNEYLWREFINISIMFIDPAFDLNSRIAI